MVVIDATTLLIMLRPGTLVPSGAVGLPIVQAKERVEYLVNRLDKAKTKILIPTPALAEILVRAGATATQQIVEHFQKYAVFSIEPFDTRAAIEVAAMSREAAVKKQARNPATTYAKLKYDRQIVAIAKVHGVSTIYSDDSDVKTLGERAKMTVTSIAELPLPPQKAQYDLLEHVSNEALNREDGNGEERPASGG